jgi:hypothetical protein
MNLRIHRTWHWELACSRSEISYGGDNPVHLVATDELQQMDAQGNWIPVEVVEAEKPPRPETNTERRYREAAERGTELGKKLLAAVRAK